MHRSVLFQVATLVFEGDGFITNPPVKFESVGWVKRLKLGDLLFRLVWVVLGLHGTWEEEFGPGFQHLLRSQDLLHLRTFQLYPEIIGASVRSAPKLGATVEHGPIQIHDLSGFEFGS